MSPLLKVVFVLSVAVLLFAAGAVSGQSDVNKSDGELSGKAGEFLAQMHPDNPPPPPPRSHAEDKQRRKQLEQFRMMELLKLLDLEDDQEIRFLTFFKDFREEEQKFQFERQEAIERLKALMRTENPSKADIYNLGDEILRINNARHVHMEKTIKEVREMLTPTQFGRFVLFQEQFELELLKRTRGFRTGPGRP